MRLLPAIGHLPASAEHEARCKQITKWRRKQESTATAIIANGPGLELFQDGIRLAPTADQYCNLSGMPAGVHQRLYGGHDVFCFLLPVFRDQESNGSRGLRLSSRFIYRFRQTRLDGLSKIRG